MKYRAVNVSLALCLALIVSGCGGTAPDAEEPAVPDPTADQDEAESTPEPEPEASPEPAPAPAPEPPPAPAYVVSVGWP